MFRYTLHIKFKKFIEGKFRDVKDFSEPIKTLREAKNYSELIDDTVSEAYIIDEVTKNIVMILKKRTLNYS